MSNLENHILVVSLPRSGSTVLTSKLDTREDILCIPECFFPAAIELLKDNELRDARAVAALFVASCPDGSPLTLDEAESCIRKTKVDTIKALAAAIATKFGRNINEIRAIVWKTTRMVGCWKFWEAAGGRFVILKRPALNVYESQFRVHFGQKNHNPFRFALFEASYLAAFSNYTSIRTFCIEYRDIPTRLEELCAWMGSSNGERKVRASGDVQAISGKHYWHANINKPFKNQDDEKLQNLSKWQSGAFKVAYFIIGRLGFLSRIARMAADKRQMASLREQAAVLLAKRTNNPHLHE